MSIKKISISNFRCFDSVDLEFSELNNFIHGANGSGKTSVLEALYFCSTGRSFKSSNKNLCIQNDKEAFKIQIDTFDNNKICILKEAKKSISLEINEVKQPQLSFLEQFLLRFLIIKHSPCLQIHQNTEEKYSIDA